MKKKGTEEKKRYCCFNVTFAKTSHTQGTQDPKHKIIYLLYKIFSQICIPEL